MGFNGDIVIAVRLTIAVDSKEVNRPLNKVIVTLITRQRKIVQIVTHRLCCE